MITVKVIREADLEALCELYFEAGFMGAGAESAFLAKVLTGSFCCVGAFDGEELIGFARALSDGVSDAYIQDVIVTQAYRRRGVGRRLVELLMAELKRHGVDWIGLIAVPDAVEFYRALGFAAMAEHCPMRLK